MTAPLRDAQQLTQLASEMAASTEWEGEIDTPPHEYLVKKLLPITGVALLSGLSGAGKSFIAIDLAGSLATGYNFFGQRVKRGGALILASEAAGTFGDRLKAYRRGKLMPDYFAASIDASQLPFATQFPIAVKAIDSITKSNIEAIIAYIEYIKTEMCNRFDLPLRLIIIDTLAAASGMVDENSSTEATAVMKLLQRIAAEIGVLVMPVVHHGKSELSGVRGSSAFEASADVRLTVQYSKSLEGDVIGRTISLGKSRVDETGWCHAFELGQHPLGADEDDDDITSCYVIDLGEPEEKLSKPKKSPTAKHRENLLTAIDEVVRTMGATVDDGWVPASAAREQFAVIEGKANPSSDAFRKQCERAERDAEAEGEIEFKGARGDRKMRRKKVEA